MIHTATPGPSLSSTPVDWKTRFAWLGVFWLAFGLRLYRLGADSLWYDETVSALLARKSLAAMWAHTARDIHPPLYYGLLHGWQALAGSSEFSLAFFSLAFGLLGVALVGYLGRRLFGLSVGLLAAGLMAVNPLSIWYGQEVRMYTLGVFLLLLALKFMLDFWARGDWRSLLGYTLTAIALLWTLYYTAFALLALNLAMILGLGLRARSRLGPWLLAQVAVLLGYGPWMPHALRQALNPPVPPWRTPLPLPQLLMRAGMEGATALLLGQSVRAENWWILGTLALGVALLAFRAPTSRTCRLPNPWAAGLLWVALLGPILLILLLSWLVTPLYHVRYLNLYSGPFPILLAAGLISLARQGVGLGTGGTDRKTPQPSASMQAADAQGRGFSQTFGFFLAGLLLFLFLSASAISLKHYHTQRFTYEAADDLRGAVTTIYRHLGPRDAVLIHAGYLYPAFVIYWPDAIGWMGRLSEYPPGQVGQGPVVVQTGFVDGDPDIGWGDPESDFYAMSRAETEARLTQLFQDHNTVWLLRGYDTVNDPQGVIRGWLEAHGQLIYDQVFPGLTYVRVQGWRTAPIRKGRPLWPPQHPQEVPFQDGITWVGFDMAPDPPQAGQPLRLTLYWRAREQPSRSYKAFVHWLGPGWQLLAQDDEIPGYGALPTDGWQPGQVVESNFVLFPPAELPAGTFLATGFYDPTTTQRLSLSQGGDVAILWGQPEN